MRIKHISISQHFAKDAANWNIFSPFHVLSSQMTAFVLKNTLRRIMSNKFGRSLGFNNLRNAQGIKEVAQLISLEYQILIAKRVSHTDMRGKSSAGLAVSLMDSIASWSAM